METKTEHTNTHVIFQQLFI